MPDYGHPLTFGTFLGPVDSPTHAAVEGARLCERLGYDLVTFQDHPYKPAFHDTLALLGWVAASTSTIHVAANVHNLPLRGQPAVLARAAASINLLSGGRFDMGLGAGHFWDPIETAGGRRLTPGRASTHSPRRSTSSAACGTHPTAHHCTWPASTIPLPVSGAALPPRATSRSGLAR